ncbi:MAG: hypothetical protein ABJB55_08225 [Actinomycetota bacterium]
MRRTLRRSVALAVVLVLASANVAFAAVTWGSRVALPGNYAWNYSNSLDFTGTPGTTNFKLHEAFVSDASLPEAIKYTSSKNGTSWTSPTKVSGAQHAEGSSLAAAGSTVIIGWFTGYSSYDPAGAARQVQVNVSSNNGGTWSGIQKLSSAKGKVDYPIVAAAKTSGGPTNAYAAWVDSKSGNVLFRESSNGGAWSAPITLGTTAATQSGAGYGFSGFANIAATDDLIAVTWIADDTGTLKARGIDLNGSATAAATLGNWHATSTLADKISVAQNGYPIASASPLNTGVVTVAYNTDTAQRFVTFNGTSFAAAKTIFTNNATYTGGYSTAVEPAPGGGFVAMWAGCRDTGITNPCNYGSAKAKFDELAATSATGTTWSAPAVVAASSRTAMLNDEASLVVIPGTSGVKVFAQYNAYKSNYGYYDVWVNIGSGSL